jgi:hypothetical protein
MRSQLKTTFEDIASMDNLLEAWGEFIKGKRSKKDVQAFGLHLMDNLMELHYDLMHRSYQHGPYHAFSISDPKPRSIHKASVRDRVLHHAIYKKLYPFFDRTFTSDSYSCRLNKGTHKALKRFRVMMNQVSRSDTRTCWVLKCDIKKCKFDSILICMEAGNYGKVREAYAEARQEFPQDFIEYIWQSIPVYEPKILDVGCGTGIATRQLAQHHHAEITGSDVDPDTLQSLSEYRRTGYKTRHSLLVLRL